MHLAAAEAVDAWRIIPRTLVAAYAYLMAYMIHWYMQLEPYVIEACVEALGSTVAQELTKCVVDVPNMQHTGLLTAVIGISAGVFGFYANTGRNWANGAYTWPMQPGDAPPAYHQPPSYYPPNYGGGVGGGYDPYRPPTFTPYSDGGTEPTPQQQPGPAPNQPMSMRPPPGIDI